ncbi:MAG: family 43 glycosylhydrolase [Pseudarcicella sp.]|nr:family 43 glycosylhydrolase [Pseudarcicella sp.]
MKKLQCSVLFLFVVCFTAFSQKPNIWLTSDFSGIKINEPIWKDKTETMSHYNSRSDADDYCAISNYLMLANRFNTVRIVLGSDGASSDQSTNAVDEFKNRFIPAYKNDVSYWNGEEGIGGYPTSEQIAASVLLSSTQGKRFDPKETYKDINTLPQSVRELVLELKNKKYSVTNPLYVLVWGPTTEVSIAVKHLLANNQKRALQNLFVVSHWTTSFSSHNGASKCQADSVNKKKYGVANCNEDCMACDFLHVQAAKKGASFRFVDVGAIGQTGIVEGSIPYFAPEGYKSTKVAQFKKSMMGEMFISSNFIHNRPDGSDIATIYVLLGNYGLTLKDFNSNGQLTDIQEQKGKITFKKQAIYMLDELLAISNIIPNSNKELKSQELNYPLIFKKKGNPLVRHIRTADPDAHVWEDGRVWVYTSQDHDSDPETHKKVGHGYSKMDGYHVFSTTDMDTWIDHGEILHSRNVQWGTEDKGWMWAPGVAYKKGTYYLYFPHFDKEKKWRTGVAISKNPQGPFIAEPNYIDGTSGIDPSCFIDDDGQAYLYFGDALVAKLSDDMLTLSEKPQKIVFGAENFKEGPYMHKVNGKYYFSWTDWKDKVNQGYYAMGTNPYGPFEYKGAVNGAPLGAQDHHSMIEFKGKWYYFYHLGNFKNKWDETGKGNRRNVAIDYLYYNTDGSLQMIKQTVNGVEKIK